MTALSRLERNGGRLLTVEGKEMGAVRLDDMESMAAPEEGLLGRNLLAITSGIGRNSTVGFGKGKTQRDQWAEEPGLGPRTWNQEGMGEEVTRDSNSGGPPIRVQQREDRLEVKEENRQERRGNRSPGWKGHDPGRPCTHGREKKPEMTKIWRNLQETDCRKGNPQDKELPDQLPQQVEPNTASDVKRNNN